MTTVGSASDRQAQATRVAAVDVGTNTALLLVADGKPGQDADRLHVVHRDRRFVRLGEGLDDGRRISAAALARLRGVLEDYAATSRRLGADRLIVAGTSASRDATNREELCTAVCTVSGVEMRILSGEEEAKLTFTGALAEIGEIDGRVLVVDVGGGSTELVCGDAGVRPAQVDWSASFDVGSVRLTERYFSVQPPQVGEVELARALIRDLVKIPDSVVDGVEKLIGAAGTATTLAAVVGNRVEAGSAIPRRLVESWSNRLLGLTRDEVLSLGPSWMAGREDVFPAGVLVVSEVLRLAHRGELVVSRGGVRHGLVLEYLRGLDGGDAVGDACGL